MFDLFRKKDVNVVDINAICDAVTLPIEEVPDITFSEKLIGDGLAFNFKGDTIYSPCDGKIILVSKTKHAIGIKCDNGAEIMIHCGLETVTLKGNGLYPQVECGQKIKKGKPILKVDRQYMDKNNIDLITPVVVTNKDDYEITKIMVGRECSIKDVVMKLTKK